VTAQRTVIAVGVRLGYDGSLWEVAELEAPRVLLRSATGGLRQVDVGHLLAQPSTRLVDADGEAPIEGVGADLSNLSRSEREELRERIAHMQELRTGYRLGHAELAQRGEPRPEYELGVGKGQRYASKAAELGIGVSTVRAWLAGFETQGPAALLDRRWVRRRDALAGVDLRWLDMARKVLGEHTEASRPTQDLLLARIQARLEAEDAELRAAGVEPEPLKPVSTSKGRQILRELSRGTGAFGGTKTKRSAANRPETPYGRLRATRPGEYLLLDTTPLDVFVMDPITLRWVNAELTIAMDLYDRCITGLRLTPVSTKAVDAAGVLFESVRPLPDEATGFVTGSGLYHGLPRSVIVDAGQLADADGNPLLPSVAAETVVVDNGKIYISDHLLSVCERLGISVQPARAYQATDKAALERFFRTLREQLLVALPGYKGPDVYSRGKDVEQDAYYFLDEMEVIIRQWVDRCYHRQKQRGLCVPEVPGLDLTPLEMFGHGVNRAGYIQVPARTDLVFDFLRVEWRTIQHYGVEVGGLRYDGASLNPYRSRTSPYTGANAGKWPLRIDPDDVSRIYFQDPKSKSWHALGWEHAGSLGGPFSAEALAYARRLAESQHRFPETKRALAELLQQWDAGLASTPAERRMAIRLSAQRLRLVPSDAVAEDPTPLPTIPSRTRQILPAPAAAEASDLEGDDDSDEEIDSEPAPADENFYATALEVM
jgi:transposase InsO family protein